MRHAMLLTVALVGLWAVPHAQATSATWTNTANGTVDSWTMAGNWNAASYPGADGLYQNASLTSSVPGSAYKSVVSTTLPNALGTVQLQNLAANGSAWMLVTNATIVATNLVISTQGRLEIDAAGIVTNTLVTMAGTNGLLLLNAGAACYPSTNLTIGSGNGRSNVLVMGDNSQLVFPTGCTLTVSSTYSNVLAVPGSNVFIRTPVTPGLGNALFTGTGTVWDCNGQRFYSGFNFTVSNTVLVAGGSLKITNNTQGFWVGYSTGSGYNGLIVTNGGRFYTQCGVREGYNGQGGNFFVVTGAGSLWDGGGASTRVGDGGSLSNTMLVDQGGTVSNACVWVGAGGGGNASLLTVTNGGQWYSQGATYVGNGCSSNLAVITGSNTFWNFNNQTLTIGSGAAYANVLRIEGGAIVTNGGSPSIGGGAGGAGNMLIVTNGGQYWLGSGQSAFVGSSSSNNAVYVGGNNATFGATGATAYCAFTIGNGNATGNVMTVDNGGVCPGWYTLNVGRTTNCYGNQMIITNGGYFQVGTVYANYRCTNAWSNVVVVVNGGVLETSLGLVADQNADITPLAGCNCITNSGGVYQFTTAAPTITPVPAHNSLIYLDSGTIAFRAIATANVKGNWSGSQLTNLTYAVNGHNAFRLNSATNATSPDQSYTFATGLGATNYSRLELINGSQYRGGSVTIGNGGTLAAWGAPSTITNLTIGGTGALEITLNGTNSVSPLTAVGSVTLGGALNLILAGPPPPAGWSTTLINKTGMGAISGRFTTSAITVSYQGTNAVFRVDYAGGDGNDLVLRSLGKSTGGTVLLFR